MLLPTPAQIRNELPLKIPKEIALWRQEVANILDRKDPRLLLILGPCSVHDPESVYEYAVRLKSLSLDISETFFPVMRIFCEKARTRLGWKGMLYDPRLDGSHDIEYGIRQSRELMIKIAELGIPCATELLEPLALPYFEDLIVWGVIGARTSASQPHRQLASGVPFPVGFKNDFRGNIDAAISGVLTSRAPHSHFGINLNGRVCKLQTQGNPHTHLVLRGGETSANYDSESIALTLKSLKSQGVESSIVVDCSHGNCGKNPYKQMVVFQSVIEQAAQNRDIAGLMLESFLFCGNQPVINPPSQLHYGISITDPCLGWEETESLLRSTSISWVQKWCSQTSTISS